jgi:hypothetical protein
MSNKFKEFIKEYGHNKFLVYRECSAFTLGYLLEYNPDYLFIIWEMPKEFCDDRVFIGDLIADSYDEILEYFKPHEVYI